MSRTKNQFYLTHIGDTNVSDGFGGFTQGEFLDVYDGDNGRLIQSVLLSATYFNHNGFIAVDDTHRRIYVTGGTVINNAQAGVVFVIDADTDTLVSTIDPENRGYTANGLAVNPVTQRVYVTAGAGVGRLAVIDGASNTLVAGFETNSGYPGRIAFNPKTNLGYIATTSGEDHSVDIIDGAIGQRFRDPLPVLFH